VAVDVAALVTRAREGDHRSVARLISLVENASPQLREVMAALTPHTGQAQFIGLTGSPGVGKSTTTGALLGDRVRMQDHATDRDVYIRSMGTRGHLGGLSWAAPQALRVLDAAGCEVVLVETVGVGQAEVEIASLADSTVVMLAPGMGDGIQAAKAGILEVADLYVVNKADREGADATIRDLRAMLTLGDKKAKEDWTPPIIKTIAAKGEGIDEVAAALDKHYAWLTSTGALEGRRRKRIADEIENLVVTNLREQVGDLRGGELLPDLAEQVMAGTTDPYAAADKIIATLERN